MGTFEQAFEDVERAAESAAKAASSVAAAAKQLMRAAQEGDISKIRRGGEKLGVVARTLNQEIANARSAWDLTPEDEQAYLLGGYEAELIGAANAAGLSIQKNDERLVAYPTLLRILPSDGAVQMNRRKVAAIRPSHLAKKLKIEQSKKPRYTNDKFIEALYEGYRLVVGREHLGKPALLMDIFKAFLLLPDASYDKEEFGRDIFSLDQSGVTRTKSGARISFPASTGTKTASNKTVTFVAPDGGLVTYYGVNFAETR